jgi:hypothetical protein
MVQGLPALAQDFQARTPSAGCQCHLANPLPPLFVTREIRASADLMALRGFVQIGCGFASTQSDRVTLVDVPAGDISIATPSPSVPRRKIITI